jgi:hypothetical protein
MNVDSSSFPLAQVRYQFLFFPCVIPHQHVNHLHHLHHFIIAVKAVTIAVSGVQCLVSSVWCNCAARGRDSVMS